MKFSIKLAEHVIEIHALYDSTRDFCREYLVEEKGNIVVQISSEDIQYEREKSKKDAKLSSQQTKVFSEEYLETLAVYRKIAAQLLEYNILLFHGSVVAVDGACYLFTAKSGTGKSTHTRLWRETFGERAVMVNDDKPLLKISEDGIVAYGTPWNGKHHLGENIAIPLKAICVLERDQENHIISCTKAEVYPMLLQQVYKPTEKEKLLKTLQLIDLLETKVGLYRLGCNMQKEAARIAYEGMK